MLKEFRQFIMRGNVVDLAVAVVIGAAFGAVVTALVSDIITPLIAAIFGKPELQRAHVHHQQEPLPLRRLPQRPDHFVTIAAAIFFFVVKPLNCWQPAGRRARRPSRRRRRRARSV